MPGYLLAVALVLGPPTPPQAPARCPTCRADLASIRGAIRDLHSPRWRRRDAASRTLAEVRWQCHPEAVAALAATLHDDGDFRVRAEAAESLGRMVADLPASHQALAEAARADPEGVVRKQARQALAAKGLRCVADCPICGPLPRGSAIVGPTLTLPELDRGPGPAKLDPAATRTSAGLPPALPDSPP